MITVSLQDSNNAIIGPKVLLLRLSEAKKNVIHSAGARDPS